MWHIHNQDLQGKPGEQTVSSWYNQEHLIQEHFNTE